jgi:hypothetical protein
LYSRQGASSRAIEFAAEDAVAMFRLITRRKLQTTLGLVLAIGIAATRTEKLLAEMQSSLPHEAGILISSVDHTLPEPFDPARVPQSGGMASRLLAGISVKPACS